MRKPLLAANWKMNKTVEDALLFAGEFGSQNKGMAKKESAWPEVVICPPYLVIPGLLATFSGSAISVGAQNVHWEEKGAFTGEISPKMLKNAGCEYVIIGHSERRQIFGETDDIVRKKMRGALDFGLKPIVCVGETLKEREEGRALEVVRAMTEEVLKLVKSDEIAKIVVAYEPLWAIGTGKEATPEDAQEAADEIRGVLGQLFGDEAKDKVRVLYGGSVKPSNVRGFMQKETIDGALVGGASLDPFEFTKLYEEVAKVREGRSI